MHSSRAKTEVILFSRNRRHWRESAREKITVGSHQVPFNAKATRWLGIYQDSRLRFSEHVAISAQRARIAERRLSSIVTRHGVPPIAARHLQEAIIGSTLMYGAEVAWRGQRGMSQTVQRTVNRMSRASLGVLSSTPVAFLQAEGQPPRRQGWIDDRRHMRLGWPRLPVDLIQTCYDQRWG